MSTLQVSNVWFESTGSQRIFATSNALIRISSNGGVQIPSGTTAGRPTNEAGILRYNTDTGLIEFGDSSSWLPIVTTLSPANSWANTVGTAGNNYSSATYSTITQFGSVFGVTNSAFAAANSKVATVAGTAGRVTSSGTTAITLDLATAGAGAASYSSGISAITVDAYGRVTAVTGSASYLTGITSGQISTALGYTPGYLNVPLNSQSGAYQLVAADSGKCISITTGGVTVPSGVFSAGDTIVIYNNSGSNQTITQGGSVTMYLVGTATTGNRTLAQRGVATVICVATNTFVISGGGLT